MTSTMRQKAEFDRYAEDYDAALAQGLAVSGEDKDFFARGRIAFLRKHLDRRGLAPRAVLDYGCGTGSATPHFRAVLGVESILGVDVSAGSLSVAQRKY